MKYPMIHDCVYKIGILQGILLAFIFQGAWGATESMTEHIEQEWTFESDDMDGWIFQTGVCAIKEGAIHHADRFFQSALTTRLDMYLSDFVLEFDLHITGEYWMKNQHWAGVIFRSEDIIESGYRSDGYLLLMRANGALSLQHRGEILAQVENTPFRPMESPYRIRLQAEGPHIQVSIDDQSGISFEHQGRLTGAFGFANYGNMAAFSNIHLSGTQVQPPLPELVAAKHPQPVSHPPVEPLPRIGVRRPDGRPAEFYNTETGKRFIPKGFNHTVLENGTGWHATFNTGTYDAESIESALTAMAASGANTVRFWAWGTQNEGGFTGGSEHRGLSGEYMENIVDFMRRAIRHGLYLVPIFDEYPHNTYYTAMTRHTDHIEGTDSKITGYNRQFFTAGLIKAKATAAADFVRYIHDSDPNLLTAVLGWSLSNEAFALHTAGPFNLSEGDVKTANGQTYNMEDMDDRQRCFDEGMLFWANSITEAILEVDPEGMVTVGMWTSDAHGRPPVNALIPDEHDPKRPPRPSVLAGPESKLAFLDIHIYQWDGTSNINTEAHEAEKVLSTGIPVLVGEFGVFKTRSIEEARTGLDSMIQNLFNLGYAGALFWVWDLSHIPEQTWSAVQEDLASYVMERIDMHAIER